MVTAGPGGGVIAIGGSVVAGDSSWRFSGTSWQPFAQGGPANRMMIAAAFDTRRNVVVAFGGVGGRNGSRYGETWEWNGRAWEERDVRGPGARDHHAMAYDEARGQVVMYGGMNGDHKGLQSDTWTWDGVTWTRAEEQSGPGGVGHHAMAYDSKRQRVVLYGGIADNGPASQDVWEWDGKTWHRISTTGATAPGPRSHIKLAYDAARGAVVMFGGGVPGAGPSGIPPTDTWTWDGRVWTRAATDGPIARYLHAMAYDARRQRVVMTAGNRSVKPYDVLADTWEWDGASWTQVRPQPAAKSITTTGAFFAVSVADLAASAAWYEEKLGLTRTAQGGRLERLGGYVVLEGGGLIVELIKHDDSTRPAAGSPEMVQGFSKAGAIVTDFDRVVATLRARGVQIVMGPYPARETVRANVIFKDNAGNLIQFFGDYSRR